MSKGFINVTHSRSQNIDYYLRENECLARYHSGGYQSNEEIKNHWKQIEINEKYGNRELGIRGRHDARISTNYILSLPNSLGPQESIDRLKGLVQETPIDKCTYTIAIHKGEKDGITNQHAHIIVNERLVDSLKKDRVMQRKEWLQNDFRERYAKTFEKEFSIGSNTLTRDRIDTYAYQANTALAKQGIKESQMMRSLEGVQSKTPGVKSVELSDFEKLAKAFGEQKEMSKSKENEQSRSLKNGLSRGI